MVSIRNAVAINKNLLFKRGLEKKTMSSRTSKLCQVTETSSKILMTIFTVDSINETKLKIHVPYMITPYRIAAMVENIIIAIALIAR